MLVLEELWKQQAGPFGLYTGAGGASDIWQRHCRQRMLASTNRFIGCLLPCQVVWQQGLSSEIATTCKGLHLGSPHRDAMTDPPPRPSPFVDDEGEAAAAADDDADTAAGAATNLRNTLAGLSSKSAWSEAWEEATEAPLIAAALSGTSFTIAQCMVDERRETESVKADEAAAVTLRHSPLATWRSDAVRLLSLALPIAVSQQPAASSSSVAASTATSASCLRVAPLPVSVLGCC
jgi:hypothetical protein